MGAQPAIAPPRPSIVLESQHFSHTNPHLMYKNISQAIMFQGHPGPFSQGKEHDYWSAGFPSHLLQQRGLQEEEKKLEGKRGICLSWDQPEDARKGMQKLHIGSCPT